MHRSPGGLEYRIHPNEQLAEGDPVVVDREQDRHLGMDEPVRWVLVRVPRAGPVPTSAAGWVC